MLVAALASVSRPCTARHISEQEFDCYCHAQPPARIVRALNDAEAANDPAQARVQLARWFEPRDVAFRHAHAGLSHVWRLDVQREERRHGPQPELNRKMQATLRSLPPS